MRRLPALVAAVTGSRQATCPARNAVCGMLRTWLDPQRPAKASVSRPRKALGRVHGHAVRFGEPADGASLLVGEGIETVLSLVIDRSNSITAAAALSAGSLGAFAPPSGVSPHRHRQGQRRRRRARGSNALPGAAGGRASPPPSSCHAVLTSTRTCSPSVPPRSPPGRRPRSETGSPSEAGERRAAWRGERVLSAPASRYGESTMSSDIRFRRVSENEDPRLSGRRPRW